MKRQLALFSLVGVSAVALFVVALTLVMAFALDSDIDALNKRARAAARAEKNLRADIAAIKSDLAALVEMDSSAANAPEAPPAAAASLARQNSIVLAHAPYAIDSPRPMKLNAVVAPGAASPECIFRPGDTERLADCIRSQQGQIGGSRSQPMFR